MNGTLCPHCRTTAGVSAARGGGYRCKLCGGPRVVSDQAKLALSGKEVPHLQEARRAGRARWLWLAASGTGGLFAFGSITFTLLLVLLFDPTAIVTSLLLGLSALPLLFALWSFRRAKRAGAHASAALNEARLGAIRDVLSDGRELSANDVSSLLALPPETSEHLLAELNVEDSVMSTVTETGDVTYRNASLRMRIDEAARAAGLEDLEETAASDDARKAAETAQNPSQRGRPR